MADDALNQAGPFDVRTIEELVALMSKHDLSEIDLRDGERRMCLRRGALASPTVAAPAVAEIAPPAASAAKAAEAPSTAQPARTLLEIKSPTVGTFYAQEKPTSPPYVAIGARVAPTTIVGTIEAMKIFNEIQAECSGVVVEIRVQNKEFVEYGTVLFRVDPNA